MSMEDLPAAAEMAKRAEYLARRQAKLEQRHRVIYGMLEGHQTSELIEMLKEGRLELGNGTADPDVDRWEVEAIALILQNRGVTFD